MRDNKIRGLGLGLCLCGCGGRTTIVQSADTARGYTSGDHRRYIVGHDRRLSPLRWLVDDDTGCWVWQRQRNGEGYGRTYVDGKKTPAHRAVYEEVKRRKIPPQMQIDHLCRNPACVNPDHMEVVTLAENGRRGRAAKLGHAGAFLVRVLAATTTLSINEIGEVLGVHGRTAYDVVRGKSWTTSVL